MRSDRITQILLASIVATLLVGIGIQAGASASQPAEPQTGQSGSAKLGSAGRATEAAPQATLPPTWRVPYVHESNGVNGAYCSTAIVILNPQSGYSGNFQVEWLDDGGGSLAFGIFAALCPGCRMTHVADNEVTPFWTVVDSDENLDNFTGSVSVHGDPRLTVAAFEWCRTAAGPGGTLVAVNDIPAYPVGAALDFFQADTPVPELPQ